VTGLRRGGAIGLEWQDIDLELGQMVVRQKGGRQDVIPMTLEARELLASRRHLPRPFSYGIKELEVLERRMKRFAKGLDIDLNTFHAFRHYFASRCLLSNLTVPETSKLLGHNDGGTLVLKTYGHLCGQHLKDAVNGLRLAS
jgi:integrase